MPRNTYLNGEKWWIGLSSYFSCHCSWLTATHDGLIKTSCEQQDRSCLTYKIMGKRIDFTFYKKYDTIESNPKLIIRDQFICRIVEECQLLSLSKIEVYSHRIQNEEIKKYLRISCISGRTEVGGRPFIVFQNTGAFPRSNSAQVGSIYLKSYAQHQLHKRYSYRWLEVEKKKCVANLCRQPSQNAKC